MSEYCVFCHQNKAHKLRPVIPSNPGEGCTYGMRHEWKAEAEDKKAAKSPLVLNPVKWRPSWREAWPELFERDSAKSPSNEVR